MKTKQPYRNHGNHIAFVLQRTNSRSIVLLHRLLFQEHGYSVAVSCFVQNTKKNVSFILISFSLWFVFATAWLARIRFYRTLCPWKFRRKCCCSSIFVTLSVESCNVLTDTNNKKHLFRYLNSETDASELLESSHYMQGDWSKRSHDYLYWSVSRQLYGHHRHMIHTL